MAEVGSNVQKRHYCSSVDFSGICTLMSFSFSHDFLLLLLTFLLLKKSLKGTNIVQSNSFIIIVIVAGY